MMGLIGSGASLMLTAPRFQALPYAFSGAVTAAAITVTLPNDLDGPFPVQACEFAR